MPLESTSRDRQFQCFYIFIYIGQMGPTYARDVSRRAQDCGPCRSRRS